MTALRTYEEDRSVILYYEQRGFNDLGAGEMERLFNAAVSIARHAQSTEGMREALELWAKSSIMSDDGVEKSPRLIGMLHGGDVQMAVEATYRALGSNIDWSASREGERS